MSGPKVTNAEDILIANDPEFFAEFDALYAKTWGGEAIPARYKELIGVTASIIIRCEPCLRHHVKMAAEAGATREEFTEAIRIAILAGGSAGVPTARTGVSVMKELGLLG
jgi:AhpD family alkylhydroperoxidase